jgi:hypothetical protein
MLLLDLLMLCFNHPPQVNLPNLILRGISPWSHLASTYSFFRLIWLQHFLVFISKKNKGMLKPHEINERSLDSSETKDMLITLRLTYLCFCLGQRTMVEPLKMMRC